MKFQVFASQIDPAQIQSQTFRNQDQAHRQK